MANSAFLLSSGLGADGKSVRATKSQASHGFSAGSVVRFVQAGGAGVSGDFVLAQASSGISAEAIGIVESVSASNNEFTVVYSGEIDTSNFLTASGGQPNGAGTTGSDVWFLDPDVAGGLTATAPTSSGDVVKPVLTLISGTDSDKGLVTNYIGTMVGGSNTVSLDTVHPVGEIIAFGGGVADVPSGWQLCNGSTLDTTTYPKYYSRVGTKYGYHAKMDFQHRGHTGFACAGNTATQIFSADTVKSDVLSYTYSSGTTGSVLLDVEPLYGITHGGETSTDNTGYPHGHIYDSTRMLSMQHNDNSCGTDAGATYTVDVATVQYVKTPDLRARTLLGAGAAYGAFDGYTAGQVGGSEDADTVVVTSDGSQRVYAAKSATSANLRQPYMAENYIIRIDDTAQAALIDGVNVSMADDGLTDHDTSTIANGDITVYDSVAGKFKPVKLLDTYPSNISAFESKFRITSDSTNPGYISIGHIQGDYPIHVKHPTNAQIRVTDSSGVNGAIWMYAVPGAGAIRTVAGADLYLGASVVNGGVTWGIVDKAGNDITEFRRTDNDVQGNLGVTGDLTITGNTTFKGQAYSPLVIDTSTGTFTPNFNNGVVQQWSTASASSLTVANPDNANSGGMYTLILVNTGGGTVGLTFGSYYRFANGIAPNLIRASSQIVVSIVNNAGLLFCTWAEDFS